MTSAVSPLRKPNTTKEQYSQAISKHALKGKDEYLFSGVNYRSLAQFLRPPSPTSNASLLRSNSTSMPWDYLTIQTYSGMNPVTTDSFNDPANAEDFILKNTAISSGCQIFFMKGFPTAEWLNTLGAVCKLNPEFIRRHLDFMQYPLYYDLPALPSSSSNIVKLKITTIGTRSTALSITHVQHSRQNELEVVKGYQNQLGANKRVGESIVRKLSNHDETTFTLEQTISCCIKRKKGGFFVFIWLDSGRSLDDCPYGPWRQSINSTSATQNSFMPIIQHRQRGPLKPTSSILDKPQSSRLPTSSKSLFQSANLLCTNYGSTLDTSTMPTSALYTVSELFSFAAHSESQFLNFVESQVTKELREFESELGNSIGNLRYHRALLDEHVEYIAQMLHLIRCGGDPSWPATKEPSTTVTEALHALELDYEHILHRAQTLVARCVHGSNIIIENSNLDASKRARKQTAMYGRLSLLAFIFVPFSFATSFFGMNFVEFGTGNKSIWIFVVLLVPLVAISTLMAFPQLINFGRNARS